MGLHNNDIIEGKSSKFNLKLVSSDIYWLLFGLQLIFMVVMSHSMYYAVTAGIFMLIIGLEIFNRKRVVVSKYHIVTIILIVYNIILVIAGISIDKNHSFNYIATVFKNLTLSIILYNFFIYKNNFYKLIEVYVKSIFISSIILLIGYRNVLFSGRLGFSWRGSDNSFQLLGLTFTPVNSNGIANYCVIAFLFSILLYLKSKKKRYLMFCSVFIFLIFLTGSRKGFIFLAMGIVSFTCIYFKGAKRYFYVSMGLLFVGLAYIVTQHMPILYEIIGSRLNELFNLLIGRNYQDASISTRQQLIDTAINYFKLKPILGYGMDSFRVMSPWQGINIDNNYLELLVSSGVVGFAIYYSFIPMVLHDYFSLKKPGTEVKLMMIIFVLSLIMQLGVVTYYGRFETMNLTILYFLLVMAKSRRLNNGKSERLEKQ